MSLRRPKEQSKPVAEKFCCQLNNDEMLFFDDFKNLKDYVADYYKRLPVFQCSMFSVKFFEIK